MPYYAGMTTLGSLIGCFMLYGVARRGGEVFLRKRLKGPYVDRALKLYQRFGCWPWSCRRCSRRRCRSRSSCSSPAPRPCRRGVWHAIVIGRGIRYFGQGYLAVLYGDRAADFMKGLRPQIGIGLAIACGRGCASS
jgi:hypothetical protein